MKKLKEFRLKSGLKTWAIVKQAGISRETLYNYEKGKCKPTLETAAKLAKIYGCSVEDFIEEA